MGIIINPRGTSGSGKTELVRRILAQYGWQRSAESEGAGGLEPIHRAGRTRPLGYRLEHPLGGRPLAVLGHYEVTSGGCDTITAADGGLDEIMRRAADYAATGHDVLIEGQHLSSEHARSAELARSHRLHILRLTTPPEQCARNLGWRRRARRDLALGRGDCGGRAGAGGGGMREARAACYGRGSGVPRRLRPRARPAWDPAAGKWCSMPGVGAMIEPTGARPPPEGGPPHLRG